MRLATRQGIQDRESKWGVLKLGFTVGRQRGKRGLVGLVSRRREPLRVWTMERITSGT
jgi:hypothetical protein